MQAQASFGSLDRAVAWVQAQAPFESLDRAVAWREARVRPVTVLEYDYWLFTHKDTPDDVVQRVLDGMVKGATVMGEVSADLKQFDVTKMRQEIGVPFHPAAVAFYEKMASE